jgi:hypothetical protein
MPDVIIYMNLLLAFGSCVRGSINSYYFFCCSYHELPQRQASCDCEQHFLYFSLLGVETIGKRHDVIYTDYTDTLKTLDSVYYILDYFSLENRKIYPQLLGQLKVTHLGTNTNQPTLVVTTTWYND